MKKIIIFFSILLTLQVIFAAPVKLRDYTLNAVFRYDFINPQGKAAVAIISLRENRNFEYSEQAGRGTAIFAGKYKITPKKIIFRNDNGIIRIFKYKLNKKYIDLIIDKFKSTDIIRFHIQPVKTGNKIRYIRVDRKPFNFNKSKKQNKTYFFQKSANVFALVLYKNNDVIYRAIIKGKKHIILKGKYFIRRKRLILEDKKGIKFVFNIKIADNKIYLKLLSGKFIIPFYKRDKILKFKKL